MIKLLEHVASARKTDLRAPSGPPKKLFVFAVEVFFVVKSHFSPPLLPEFFNDYIYAPFTPSGAMSSRVFVRGLTIAHLLAEALLT